MKTQSVARDERTLSVENSSYRWAYLLLAFGLLAIVAFRGLAWHENNWDLLGLVILSGGVTTLYQGAHKVLSRRWALAVIVTGIVAAAIATGIAVWR